MRKKIIAANWKMNMTIGEAESFLKDFRLEIEDVTGVEIVIAPPFTALPKLSELLGGSQKVRLGAQNFISKRAEPTRARSARPCCATSLFATSSSATASVARSLARPIPSFNKKVLVAHASELKPILCVGETLEEREAGKEKQVLETQLRGGLAGVSAEQLVETVIAYEPVWAIGTGKTATSAQAQDAHAHVRAVLAELTDAATADKVRIQYGGSVKPANALELLSQPDIDGALVGGASLEARGFAEIVKAGVPA